MRAAPRSELRLVTCLFLDIVGSTDLAVSLGPERMQRLVARAFDVLRDVIDGQGGAVEKFIGDAVFALFGAPTAHDDDAVRALRAAEECVTRAAGLDVALRVGVETGVALVDLHAAGGERQRMAVGTCVNTAARLQNHASPGAILVGPGCHDATGGAAEFEPLGTIPLRGIGDVPAWRLVRTISGGAAQVPFVGRAEELARLEGAVARARAGRSTFALVIGPAGQGKTRLVDELIAEVGRGVRMLGARCRPSAESGVLPPLAQLLASDVSEPSVDGVRERVRSLVPDPREAERTATILCHSAGLADDPALRGLGRWDQDAALLAAWRAYLHALASDQLLVLRIEDLHWADSSIVRLLEQLVVRDGAPLFAVATARPQFLESAHVLPEEDRLVIELGSLDADSAAALARSAGGDAGLVTRAEGHPLFIIELARARASGADVPLTLQAAIGARLDELAQDERELLQRAAVVGETFAARDLALIAERDPAEVAGALGRLMHLGVVVPVSGGYRFQHALVHDVAYGRLPLTERMKLHALFARHGVRRDDLETLAHHWWEALRPPDAKWVWEDEREREAMRREALALQLGAARRMGGRFAYDRALDTLGHALALAEGPAEIAEVEALTGQVHAWAAHGEEAWAHRVRALDLYAGAGADPPAKLYADLLEIPAFNWGYFRGLPDESEVERMFAEGERTARRSGDDVSLARILAARGVFFRDSAAAAEGFALVRSARDPVPYAEAFHRLGFAMFIAGDIRLARSLFEQVFDRLVGAGARINEPEALIWRGLLLYHAGDLAAADRVADRLLEQSARRSPHTRSHALAIKGLVAYGRGDWEDARERARSVGALVEEHADAGWCLLGAAAIAYGAVAELRSRLPLPPRAEQLVERMVTESALVRAGTLMVPRVMAGVEWREAEVLASYDPKARLWDWQEVWDPGRIQLGLAYAMLGSHHELERLLPHYDRLATNGSELLAAFARAVREEIDGAGGGPQPTHADLRALGYAGLSELLSYRARG